MPSPSQADPTKIWQSYDTFIFDADGVLWTGPKVIDGAVELIDKLLNAGKTVLILTNNSTRSCDQHLQKCVKLGFKGLTKENIVSAAFVCAHELVKLKQKAEFAATAHLPVYLIGSTGLQNVLKENGIDSFGVGPDLVVEYTKDRFIMDMDLSQKPFAVVCSFDSHISYPKIMRAVNYLKNPHIPFMVTNQDITYPGPNPDIIYPDAGTMSTIISAVSGRTPTVMGKPNRATWDYIFDRLEGRVNPKTTLMIGDRCDTDIQFGNDHGLDTLMVLSGINTLEDIEKFQFEGKIKLIPKYVVVSVKDLLTK